MDFGGIIEKFIFITGSTQHICNSYRLGKMCGDICAKQLCAKRSVYSKFVSRFRQIFKYFTNTAWRTKGEAALLRCALHRVVAKEQS